MTTTATNALTARPGRRAPVWISIVNTCTAAVVLLALPAAAIWIAIPAFIALAILTRTVRAARSG
jgi:hypothetical protein